MFSDFWEIRVTFVVFKCRWPVRTISVSYDGELIASGSEENNKDIVRTGF